VEEKEEFGKEYSGGEWMGRCRQGGARGEERRGLPERLGPLQRRRRGQPVRLVDTSGNLGDGVMGHESGER